MEAVFLVVLAVHAVLGVDVPTEPTILTELNTDTSPAFCSVIADPVTGVYDIGYSSFTGRMTVADTVWRIPDITSTYYDAKQMTTEMITNSLEWPNEVAAVPDGVFGSSFMWSVAGGFFLPGKDKGAVSIIDMTDPTNPGEPVEISSSEAGVDWFYHRVLWNDMDYDGDLDAVTERAYGSGDAATESQIVWFENPGSDTPTPHWTSHLIDIDYEDVSFRLQNFPLPDGSETLVIVSAGFYSHSLTLTWTTDGDWSNEASIQHRIIDDYGFYFDLQMVDLNKDGVLDILTTTWSQPGYQGAVLGYEQPTNSDWRTGDWTRNVIDTDYEVSSIAGSGSPGAAQSMWPTQTMQASGEKPYIVVSGDDDGTVYLLVPNSADTSDWTYARSIIFKSFGTVGAIAVADVDSDGYTEIFIPAFTVKKIPVLSYRPT